MPFCKVLPKHVVAVYVCVSFSFVLYSPYWAPHPTRNPQKASDEMTNWFSTRSSVGTAECVGAFHGTRATSIVRLMIVTSFGRRDMMRMGNHITILRPRMWYRSERTGKQGFVRPSSTRNRTTCSPACSGSMVWRFFLFSLRFRQRITHVQHSICLVGQVVLHFNLTCWQKELDYPFASSRTEDGRWPPNMNKCYNRPQIRDSHLKFW